MAAEPHADLVSFFDCSQMEEVYYIAGANLVSPFDPAKNRSTLRGTRVLHFLQELFSDIRACGSLTDPPKPQKPHRGLRDLAGQHCRLSVILRDMTLQSSYWHVLNSLLPVLPASVQHRPGVNSTDINDNVRERSTTLAVDPRKEDRRKAEFTRVWCCCRGDSTKSKRFTRRATTNKPDAFARYRFRQTHLRFLSTFADVRGQPGWILPSATKILVNVKGTGDADTWRGQVEGSEECGMFFHSAVERML